MAGLGNNLTRRQESAIVALLNLPSIHDAAEASGTPERTLFRWLQDPAFSAAYRQARREVLSMATARLQRAAETAVETLEAVMKDAIATPAARVSAARAVIEFALKGLEMEDLEARVEALEKAATV